MNNLKLLDCTLRDGGYLNDWNFGNDSIINIFQRLISAKVDIIEIGFLDDRIIYDENRTILPDGSCVDETFGFIDKEQSLIVGMIDYGTCKIENLQPCSESYLDGIRVIFKKNKMIAALKFCEQVKNLGYKVFVQPVSITSYSEDEYVELLQLVNELKPYAFSVVDTYGLLHKNELLFYFEKANHFLIDTIGLGYHSHNNFQLAYSNCIELLEKAPTDRLVVIDGTLFGMGKGAGNAPLELLAMYMNEHKNKRYKLEQILEAIDTNIVHVSGNMTWGYSLKCYISAMKQCHPNYVSYLFDKKTLSVKSIMDILITIKKEKKLFFDEKYIEKLYVQYQEVECDDSTDFIGLKEAFTDKRILLLGPGNSMVKERERILDYICENKPLVIAVNFYPDIENLQYLFISNSRRYVQLSPKFKKIDTNVKLIATSNVTKSKGKFDYTLRYNSLLSEEAQFRDNPLIMLVKLFKQCKVSEIALAGFDGYTNDVKSNYFDAKFEYSFTKEKANILNKDAVNELSKFKDMDIKFITESNYNKYL